MSSYGDMAAGGGPDTNITLQAMKEVAKDTRQELYAERLTSKEGFQISLQEIVNPFVKRVRTKQKTKKAHLRRIAKLLKKGEKAERVALLKQISRRSEDFERRNPELKSKILLLLREQIKPGDSPEEILKKVQDFYPDVSLADEALEFLLETTEGTLYKQIQNAKTELNDDYGREISAGRNIGELAREAEGLGTPTTLRDLYREITGSPREATTLFDELSRRYPFKQLKKVFKFLFHSLGTDMKSKGPSIPRGQLHTLLNETRTLQAILGVYRFFAGRMKLLQRLFAKEGIKTPQRLDFELLSKQFMALCSERYPSSDKVLKQSKGLGINKWVIAQIIVFSQMRDAIRQVAMNQIFRSLQHRDELYDAIIEALEDLEDQWEEILEQEESEIDGEENDNEENE
ncbi:MAG: HrpJ domain-containing protein [Chlamydiota bacterium]|nr:HrpJ domain-containing protein [Chlamydiota bacterium]